MESERRRHFFEAVGVIAVVSSVVILIYEIRQNTNATIAATIHELYRDSANIYQTPEYILDIRVRADRGEDISRHEQLASRQHTMNVLRMFQNQWHQNQLGILPDDHYELYKSNIASSFGGSPTAALYKDVYLVGKQLNGYDPGFVAFLEEYLAEWEISLE